MDDSGMSNLNSERSSSVSTEPSLRLVKRGRRDPGSNQAMMRRGQFLRAASPSLIRFKELRLF
jgi:hypothetical protein